jgi:hypothetical protein
MNFVFTNVVLPLGSRNATPVVLPLGSRNATPPKGGTTTSLQLMYDCYM